MKKFVVMLILLIVCVLFMYAPFTAITDTSIADNVEYTNDGRKIQSMSFILVYDPITRIVYYKTASVYLPYISKNGTYTKYQNGSFYPIGRW